MHNPPRIGIVGGGQLGKMMTLAAKKMGFYVTITDPTPQSPAGQVADKEITGGYKDEKTTLKLAENSDFITIDAEFVNDETLEIIEKKGIPVNPSPETIRIIKDKLLQKEFLKKHKIPTAEFIEISGRHSGERSDSRTDSGQARMTIEKDIEKAGEQFGYPFLLKARFDAYDGKGNYVVKNKQDILKGLQKLEGRTLYIEKFVPFKKELAIMVAQSTKGKIAVYPVVQTIHKNNICDLVLAPAPVSKKAIKNAQALAYKVMKKMKGAGVFGIEMFLIKNDEVLVNEIAPRVHNSGHYTTEACITSQFEQHIRAITGLPLGSTKQTVKAAVMKNILGEKDESGYPQGIEKALTIPDVSIHMYSKEKSRPGRKMGHITVVGDTIAECLKKANKARKALTI